MRRIGHAVVQTFLPTFSLVFVSWIAFWIDVNLVIPKLSLGTVTLLTLITLSGNVRQGLPQVSYTKAVGALP